MIQPHRSLIHYSLLSQQVLGAFAQLLLQASPGRSVITVVKRCSPNRHHGSRDRAPVPGCKPFQLFWQLVMARDCRQMQICNPVHVIFPTSSLFDLLFSHWTMPCALWLMGNKSIKCSCIWTPVRQSAVRLPTGNGEIFSPSRFPLFSSRLGNILPMQVWD